MGECPYCGCNIEGLNELRMKTITQTRGITMITCKNCNKLLGFSEKG